MWKAYLEPLKSQGLQLGTPAPSSAPSGKTWLQQFLSICGDECNPDFVALRQYQMMLGYIRRFERLILIVDWYDVNATVFQEYVEDFHNTFGLPIWVTEWDCQVSGSSNHAVVSSNKGPSCNLEL